MTSRGESRSLIDTFDALAAAQTRPRAHAPRLPFVIIACIVALDFGTRPPPIRPVSPSSPVPV